MKVYWLAKAPTAPFLMSITFSIAMDLAKPKPCCMQIIAEHRTMNSAFLWYFLWRVMNGLLDSINYDFLLLGHTKFAPDWCFGLVKQKTFISSLFDIARTVEDSAEVNVAELVGLHNGTVLITTYDWVTYLGQYFKKLPQIKSFYHFTFDKEHPGSLLHAVLGLRRKGCKSFKKSKFSSKPWSAPRHCIEPQGISREWADYLYKEIREFCCDGTENLVSLQGL